MRVQIADKEAAVVINVWKWYKDSEDALLKSKQKLLSRVRGGKSLPREFIYKSEREITEQFSQTLKELRYATMLGLISAIEAAFRIDHQIRIDGKKDDEISKKFIRLSQKKKGKWSKFGDDILEAWMNIASNKKSHKIWNNMTLVEEFKEIVIRLIGLLHLRDWLAHGRCWERKFTQQYDPDDIIRVAKRLMDNLPINFYGRKYLSA